MKSIKSQTGFISRLRRIAKYNRSIIGNKNIIPMPPISKKFGFRIEQGRFVTRIPDDDTIYTLDELILGYSIKFQGRWSLLSLKTIPEKSLERIYEK